MWRFLILQLSKLGLGEEEKEGEKKDESKEKNLN